MTSANSRTILLVDLDAFYAECEEKRNPAYRDVPLVICVYSARGGDSGAVATANYIARGLGVKSGIPIYRAKRILRDLKEAIFLRADFDYYEAVSERVMALLRGYADRFEQVSVDEAYIDVTQKVGGDFGRSREVAVEIKRKIRETEGLTCSIGIGSNKLIAKMAADFQKPDGLTIVKPGEDASFLSPLKVRSLHGVGVKTEKRLNELGIKTIGGLAKHDVSVLAEIFGRKYGAYLHNAANGIDEEPVQEQEGPETISRITTLRENTRDIAKIWPDLEQLIEALHSRVLQEKLQFRSIGIIGIMRDLSLRTRSTSFDTPTDSVEVLKKAGRELVEGFLQEGGELMLRRVGVKVGQLSPKPSQLSLAEFQKPE